MANFSMWIAMKTWNIYIYPLNILFVSLLADNSQYLYKPGSKLLAIVPAKIPSENSHKCPQNLDFLPIARDMAVFRYLPFKIRAVLAHSFGI